MFGLESTVHPQEGSPPFLMGREVFLNCGRSCICVLVDLLQPSQVWVPSYLCPAGILGAIDTKVTVPRFFEVDRDLKVPSKKWISEVNPGDVVIFIDYFGFPYDRGLAADVKKNGAWVVEDACQALLSKDVGKLSDFVVFSLIKWFGVPDGGILRFTKERAMNAAPPGAPPASWWLKALRASLLRREFDDGVPSREWFTLFREKEIETPIGLYAMSQLSQIIMDSSVDYPWVAKRRLDNYRTLLARLVDYAMFPDIGPDTVPLGFPVRIRNRDAVREALFEHQIYPPVHWNIAGVVPPEFADSHELSDEIMTLPCDQRYGREDMERMADVFLKTARCRT